MPAVSRVSQRVPILTIRDIATTGATGFSRTSTVMPLASRARVTTADSAEAGDTPGRGRAVSAQRTVVTARGKPASRLTRAATTHTIIAASSGAAVHGRCRRASVRLMASSAGT